MKLVMILMLVVLLTCIQQVTSQTVKDCMRNSNMRWRNGKCEQCEKCRPGFGLSEDCGHGAGGNAKCVPCVEGVTFNSGRDKQCMPCLNCTRYHREFKYKCRPEINAVCGKCLNGFFDPLPDSGEQLSCSHCSHSYDNKECELQDSSTGVNSSQKDNLILDWMCRIGSILFCVIAFSVLFHNCFLRRKIRTLTKQLEDGDDPPKDTVTAKGKSVLAPSKKRKAKVDQTISKGANGCAKKRNDDIPLLKQTEIKTEHEIIPSVKKEHERRVKSDDNSQDKTENTDNATQNCPRTQTTLMNEMDESRYRRALSLSEGRLIDDFDIEMQDTISLYLSNRSAPGDKNYHHVAEKFGIAPLVNKNLRGMNDLYPLLRQERKTVDEFVRVLFDLKRYDVVNLLSDWAFHKYQSQPEDDSSSGITTVGAKETGDARKCYLFNPPNYQQELV